MRCLTAVLAFLFATLVAGTGFAQGDTPKGLFLTTDYPSQTVRAGEVTTIRLKLTNAGLPPEPVALALKDVPAGWKIDILGGGQPVAAAMPGVNQDVSLQLRVDVPKDAKPGSRPGCPRSHPYHHLAGRPAAQAFGDQADADRDVAQRIPVRQGGNRDAGLLRGGRVAAAIELAVRDMGSEWKPAAGALSVACRSLSRQLATEFRVTEADATGPITSNPRWINTTDLPECAAVSSEQCSSAAIFRDLRGPSQRVRPHLFGHRRPVLGQSAWPMNRPRCVRASTSSRDNVLGWSRASTSSRDNVLGWSETGRRVCVEGCPHR